MRANEFLEGKSPHKKGTKKYKKHMAAKHAAMGEDMQFQEAYISSTKDAIETLGALRGKGKQLERGQQEYKGNLPNEYVNDVYDVYTWMENKLGGFPAGAPDKLKPILKDVMALRGEAKKMERIYKPDLEQSDEHMGAATFGNMVVNTLYPLMQFLDMNDKMFESQSKCKEGEYWCRESKKCKPIPDGHKLDDTGYLVKETATQGATSAGNIAVVASVVGAKRPIKKTGRYGAPKAPQKLNSDGTAKNALDVSNNIMGGKAIKR